MNWGKVNNPGQTILRSDEPEDTLSRTGYKNKGGLANAKKRAEGTYVFRKPTVMS